jgi:hypothetical protein
LKKKKTLVTTFFALLQGNGEFAFLLWFRLTAMSSPSSMVADFIFSLLVLMV